MKAEESPDYNHDFPETFNWNLLESRHLTKVAREIKRAIEDDLTTEWRYYTGGLRIALNIIAKHAEI